MNDKSQDEDTDKSGEEETKAKTPKPEKEFGGYESQGLPEPTRYKDWEVRGRCSDF